MPDLITIVNSKDDVIGSEERKIARQKGLTHRMVKIILINSAGNILVQQRSANKSESPLKWDVSAAGHVDAGEDYADAAARETAEELNITDLKLTWIGKYYYERTKDDLTLRRFNGIFTAHTDKMPRLEPSEVAQVQWITPTELATWLTNKPSDFTTSFKEIFDRYGSEIRGNN